VAARIGPVSEYLELLKLQIERTENCKAVHIETVPVIEDVGGEQLWSGEVEVFDLVGHPETTRCYAWGYKEGNKGTIKICLNIPPVDSPEAAVHAVMAGK
jgi:hypothetical protein